MHVNLPKCSFCSEDIRHRWDIGSSLLANKFSGKPHQVATRYPLELGACNNCGLISLQRQIDPEKMFANTYSYQSSMSSHFVKHCENMCQRLTEMGLLEEGLAVMEVAANDGALADVLIRMGCDYLAVEPSSNNAHLLRQKGCEVIEDFFDKNFCSKYGRKHSVDVVVAQNVIGHIPDIKGFIRAIYDVLTIDGVAIIEIPSFEIVASTGQFEQVYHEHFHHITVPFMEFAAHEIGFGSVSCESVNIHGGSHRFYLSRKKNFLNFNHDAEGVVTLLSDSSILLEKLQVESLTRINQTREKLNTYFREGHPIIGLGAAAKMYAWEMVIPSEFRFLKFVCDSAPKKLGMFIPETDIEIKSFDNLDGNRGIGWIFPYNIQQEIRELSRTKGFLGEFFNSI